ncbi:hypothetical protein O181_066269 [Austropuccinia psidii MF-1]|uniref:Reverse transcriptase RNase H-like domain-containing protein n=1 Tax=Austropuccinia psidii MF-1 TaxID=1389203 RepID=A0A9Q3I5D8_9BASI|nr:hypothetical protein [Austropuccinia psidii MF-1]
MSKLPENIPLIILNSSESLSLFVTYHTKYMVELPSFPSFECDFLVIDTPKEEDLILGFDFLDRFNPSIDWKQGLITFNADKKDYYYPSKPFSSYFSSSKLCADLVGDSRTPSLPSSAHIPSLSSLNSLLSSRDEVFKEIQDVGEDNSVSSLHIFFENMDLPPSSYHDSLEELWDEEEEPEEMKTVMKVVPSVYHQYLDVFCKVKAANLPPHHACDHHIELEGSLPPANTSNYALGAVLSQVSDSGKHPIAFDSRKLIPAELNYEIHDKELLGIVGALKRWRAFLLSLSSPFEVLFNTSFTQRFLLTIKPTGLNSFLNFISQSLTALAALSSRDNVYPERGRISSGRIQ